MPEMLFENMTLVAAVAIGSAVAGSVVAHGFYINRLQSNVAKLQKRVKQLERRPSAPAADAEPTIIMAAPQDEIQNGLKNLQKRVRKLEKRLPAGPAPAVAVAEAEAVAPAVAVAHVAPVKPVPVAKPAPMRNSTPNGTVRRSDRLKEKRLDAYAALVPYLNRFDGTSAPEKAKAVLGRALFRRILDNISDVEALLERHPEFKQPIIDKCLWWNKLRWNKKLVDSSAELLKVVAKEELTKACRELQGLINHASATESGKKRADEVQKMLNYIQENPHNMRIMFAAHPTFKTAVMKKCEEFMNETNYPDTVEAAQKVLNAYYDPYRNTYDV